MFSFWWCWIYTYKVSHWWGSWNQASSDREGWLFLLNNVSLSFQETVNSSEDLSTGCTLAAVIHAPENREGSLSLSGFICRHHGNTLYHCIVFSSSLPKLTTRKSILQMCPIEFFVSQSLNHSTIVNGRMFTDCLLHSRSRGKCKEHNGEGGWQKTKMHLVIEKESLVWQLSKVSSLEPHIMEELAPSHLRFQMLCLFVDCLNTRGGLAQVRSCQLQAYAIWRLMPSTCSSGCVRLVLLLY